MYMDIKLEDTSWHRITSTDMHAIKARKKRSGITFKALDKSTSAPEMAAEQNKIYFTSEPTSRDVPVVESEEEEAVFHDVN